MLRLREREAACKEMLGARDEDAKGRCLEDYKEEKRKVKSCIYQSKKKVNEQFEMNVNEDVNGNRKLFWKEITKVNGGKVESCSRIKDGNGRLGQKDVLSAKDLEEVF